MHLILEPGTTGRQYAAICLSCAGCAAGCRWQISSPRHQAVTLRGLRAAKLSSKSLHRDGETISPLPRELKNERAAPANARKGFSMAHKSSSPPAPNAKFARETNEIHRTCLAQRFLKMWSLPTLAIYSSIPLKYLHL
jgi:hypothetical protein